METNLDEIVPFRPAPWCVNGHVHTIGRSLFSRATKPDCRRIEIETPDDDFLEIDLAGHGEDCPVIALFHGLEGSTNRFYMAELMQRLAQENYTVVGVNFRGCGSRLNRQRRFYHSGETEDFKTVFRWIRQHFPRAPIGAVGFSLGGNALMKSLGEEGDQHPVTAAVTVSVPFDLRMASLVISRGFNRVYEIRFLQTLNRKLSEKRLHYPDLPRFAGSTLYEFDDRITAPVHGFRDADDYYTRCSARRYVESIHTPTLVIHSSEDPICPVEAVPVKKLWYNPATDYIVTHAGGHVGFWSRPSGWLNRTIMNYFNSIIG